MVRKRRGGSACRLNRIGNLHQEPPQFCFSHAGGVRAELVRINEAKPVGDFLYLGSLDNDRIGKLKIH